MSDLVYAMNVSAARAEEQNEQVTFAAGIKTALEAGYTAATVEWCTGEEQYTQHLPTSCIHVDKKSGVVHLCAPVRFYVTEVTGLQLSTPGQLKGVDVDTVFPANRNGDRRVVFELKDFWPESPPIQVGRGDAPSFEQTKMVQFEFSTWTAGGSAAVKQMCTVLLNGRQHTSCIADSKVEAYKLAFERSVELLAQQPR